MEMHSNRHMLNTESVNQGRVEEIAALYDEYVLEEGVTLHHTLSASVNAYMYSYAYE
jgi:hypothetical protein